MIVMRYLLGLLFFVLATSALLALVTLIPLLQYDWSIYIYFILGMAAYIIVLGLNESVFKINSKLIRTFVHEFIHTIFAWLSFKEVRNFRVSHYRGGEVTIVGGTNMLIILSPYCIPIFTLILLLVKPFLLSHLTTILDAAIGFTYLFHLHTNCLQTGLRQTDITKYPLLTSFSFIALFQFLFAGIILLSLQEGYNAFWEFPMLVVDKLQFLYQYFITASI